MFQYTFNVSCLTAVFRTHVRGRVNAGLRVLPFSVAPFRIPAIAGKIFRIYYTSFSLIRLLT